VVNEEFDRSVAAMRLPDETATGGTGRSVARRAIAPFRLGLGWSFLFRARSDMGWTMLETLCRRPGRPRSQTEGNCARTAVNRRLRARDV
jgi:hypothetical protein